MNRRDKLLLGLGLVLLSGCVNLPPRSEAFIGPPDSPDRGLTVELGPERDGLSALRLTVPDLRTAVVSGEAKSVIDGWRISFRRLDWFSNWANGWTQASFLLDGTAYLRAAPGGWSLEMESPPQLDTVESASIRYFDTYVRDDRGLTEFSHRWDRIQAVVSDLLTRMPASALAGDPRVLRRYLFPEIYGYDSPPAPGQAKVSVQGFEWNRDYTKEHFAEPLRVLRDSGTLLRDYKESPGLWYLALEWKNLWAAKDRPMLLRGSG